MLLEVVLLLISFVTGFQVWTSTPAYLCIAEAHPHTLAHLQR